MEQTAEERAEEAESQVENLSSENYDLQQQVRRLQDDIEDLHAKLEAKNKPLLEVAAKQVALYDGKIFVIDGAGSLWWNNFSFQEGWHRVELPEVSNG